MTVSSLKKSLNNNNNNNSNETRTSSDEQLETTENVNSVNSTIDENPSNNLKSEENSENVASSSSKSVTTSMSNDSSFTSSTTFVDGVHPKKRSNFRRPNAFHSSNKANRWRVTSHDQHFPNSSNSDSTDDDSFFDDLNRRKISSSKSEKESSRKLNGSDRCNSEDEHEQKAEKQRRKESKNLEIRFARTLKEKKGLIIKSVKEDGACLFRAVADQVFGDEEMHDVVRQHCMNYIQQNDDFFRSYITEDFDRYVTRKRRNSCHGNHIEIIALSEVYNRPIEVYEYSLEPRNVVHGMFETDNEPIRLSYHSAVHYNSIVDPWRPTAGLGLGLPDLRPGDAQKNLIDEAVEQSEKSEIDKTLFDQELVETDLAATQQEIFDEISRQSYIDWLREKNSQSNEKTMVSSSNPNATTSVENFVFNDEESMIEQILALSTMEYVESLSKNANNQQFNGENFPS